MSRYTFSKVHTSNNIQPSIPLEYTHNYYSLKKHTDEKSNYDYCIIGIHHDYKMAVMNCSYSNGITSYVYFTNSKNDNRMTNMIREPFIVKTLQSKLYEHIMESGFLPKDLSDEDLVDELESEDRDKKIHECFSLLDSWYEDIKLSIIEPRYTWSKRKDDCMSIYYNDFKGVCYQKYMLGFGSLFLSDESRYVYNGYIIYGSKPTNYPKDIKYELIHKIHENIYSRIIKSDLIPKEFKESSCENYTDTRSISEVDELIDNIINSVCEEVLNINIYQ